MRLLIEALVSIKNGCIGKRVEVCVKKSNFIRDVLTVLVREGFINNFVEKDRSFIVDLKYVNGVAVLRTIKLVSVPSKPVYVKAKDIDVLLSGNDIYLISTNKGIFCTHGGLISGFPRLGGQVLCMLQVNVS